MKKLTINDPFLFGEWFNLGWFHSCYLSGSAATIRERLGYGLSQVVAEQEDTVQRIYFSRSEWTAIGERYLQEVIKRPALLARVLRDLRQAARSLIAFSQRLEPLAVDKLTRRQQIKILNQYHAKHHSVWALGQVPNILELENSFLTDYLKGWLKGQPLEKTEQLSAFQALSTPRELSAAQQEERAMLALAQQPNPALALRRHWQRYYWLQFGWTGPNLTEDYFRAVHAGLYREGQAQERRQKLLQHDRQLRRDKKQWQKRLRLPLPIKRLFRLLEEILFTKAYRMDALYHSYGASQPLLKKIARDQYLSLPQIYSLYLDWLIPRLQQNQLDVDWVNQVGRHSVRYWDGRQWYLILGEAARLLVAPLRARLPLAPETQELHGESAYPGRVRGQVFVINHADEMPKFVAGGILVSNVTDPSLLPVMKQAAAFVTNMGGLTCHAAIVARELQIPCVVGTKAATRVFKDGDRVEVDATKGVVKKI